MSKTITSFDFETTGLNTAVDQVCSFSFINFNIETRERKVFARLCKPSIPIPELATAVHGITNEMVENEPPFSHFIPEILAIIEGTILSGHNIIRYDIPMLYYELKRAGYNWVPDFKNVIDIMQVHREFFSSSLSAVFKQYSGNTLEGAHGAVADSDAVIQIITAMMKEHNLATVDQMIAISTMKTDSIIDFEGKLYKNASGIVCFNFGKYKDWSVTEAMQKDSSYKKWIEATFPGTSLIDKINELVN